MRGIHRFLRRAPIAIALASLAGGAVASFLGARELAHQVWLDRPMWFSSNPMEAEFAIAGDRGTV